MTTGEWTPVTSRPAIWSLTFQQSPEPFAEFMYREILPEIQRLLGPDMTPSDERN